MAQVTLKIKIDLPGIRSELEQVVREIKEKLEPLGVIEFEADLDDFKDDLEDVEDKVNKTGKAADSTREKFAQWGMILSGFQSAKTIISDIYSILSMPLDVAGQFEDYNTQFEVLLGSTDKAKKMIADLTDFASRTPLELPGILENTKMLLNFGVEADSVMDIIQMIGDVSGGNAQRMSSLTLAFAQMSSTGRLTGQDLLQMINAGFNPLQAISEKTGKSIGELKKDMEAGAISADMVTEAFRSVTSEGGQFYNMLQKQSTGWNGLKSTFTDTMNEMAMELGDKLLPAAKGTLNFLIENARWATKNMDDLLSGVKVLSFTIVAYTIAVNGAAIAGRAYAIATNLATVAAHGFNTAIKANPIGLAVTAITLLVTALGELTNWFGIAEDASDEFTKSQNEAAEASERLANNMNRFINEYKNMSGPELQKILDNINESLSDPKILGNWKEELTQRKQAIEGLLDGIVSKEKQTSIEIARLKVEAMEDGFSKEKAVLDLWLREMKEKYVDNAEATSAVVAVYNKNMRDLELKYWNEVHENAKKSYEEKEKLRQEDIERERKAAEEKLKIEQRINALKEESNQDYFDNKYNELYDNLNAEFALLRARNSDAVGVAIWRYQEEKRILSDMLHNNLISQNQYNNEVTRLYAQSLEEIKREYSQYTSFVADTALNLLNSQERYTQNDIDLKQFQYQEERKALQESLANQEISRREYDLRMRALEEDRSRFLKDVEEDRKGFVLKFAQEALNFLVKKTAEWVAEYAAQKLAELAIDETTSAAKTALYTAEVSAQVTLATLAISSMTAAVTAAMLAITATASSAATLVSIATLGGAAASGAAAVIAALTSVKAASSLFKKGGYTGDGDPDEEAGIVHKNEYVFESSLVSKEPDKFALLHRLLRGGMSLTDILHNLSAAMGDPSAPARLALSGINLTSPAVQQQMSNNSKIESLLTSIDDRLKSQNETGIKIKLESAVVSIRYSIRELFTVLKLRQKLEDKRTVENG